MRSIPFRCSHCFFSSLISGGSKFLRFSQPFANTVTECTIALSNFSDVFTLVFKFMLQTVMFLYSSRYVLRFEIGVSKMTVELMTAIIGSNLKRD